MTALRLFFIPFLAVYLSAMAVQGCSSENDFTLQDRSALVSTRNDVSAIRQAGESVGGDLAAIKSEITAVKGDVSAVRGDVSAVKSTVTSGGDTNSTSALIAAIVTPPVCFVAYWHYKRRVYARENGKH